MKGAVVILQSDIYISAVSCSGIRTALLDSDQHICPTCSQSDVSPDTLIANKFLRQVSLTNKWKICFDVRDGGDDIMVFEGGVCLTRSFPLFHPPQAVNTFQKEQGHPKSLRGRCGTSQSQNPTWAPSPVPTPPPLAMQSQPQKPHQPTHSQQVSLIMMCFIWEAEIKKNSIVPA